jgi:creatinine amidohydrolase
LIPVGSTEQHGPHNPLGTDHLLAAVFAKQVGENTGALVTPVIPVGVSRHHRQFPGTLWVSPSTFREYMMEVALSLTEHRPTKIVFINGHGGNTSALLEVCEELRIDYDIFGCTITSYPPGKLKGHAAEGETSQNLYYHPELVDMKEAVDTKQENMMGKLKINKRGVIGPANYPWDTIDISESGVLGEPGITVYSTTASVEMGRELMEPYTEEVTEFVKDLMKTKLEELLPKPYKSLSY